MLSRPKETDIDIKDPFAPDRFQRKELALGLVKLLRRMEGPMTIALTAPYGGGKTFFLERCKCMLQAEEIPVVMINAWESDFTREPIAPLIAEFSTAFGERIPEVKKTAKKIRALAGKVAAAAIPVGLKILTAGLLSADDLTASAVSEQAQKFAEKQLEEFEKARGSIVHLREQLSAMAEEIRPKGEKRPPVVVIIDELDRCRPTYAVEMLEVVKHLFAIPGIVFVLGIDKEQLASAAGAVFGERMDSDGYLRRFIDLECKLPKPDAAHYCLHFGLEVIEKMTGAKAIWFQGSRARAASQLCSDAGFSIRKLHQFLTRVGIGVAAGCENDGEEIALLTFLDMYDSRLYRGLIAGQISAESVREAISKFSPSFLEIDSFRQSIPFLDPLAIIGAKDLPRSFIDTFRDALSESDARKPICQRFDMSISEGYRKSYLARLSRAVDFGAAFIAR